MQKRIHSIFQVGFALVTIMLLFVFFLLSLASAGPEASTLYVDAAGGSDDSDCTNPVDPCASIQHSLVEAGSGDKIYVAQGSYDGFSLNFPVSLLGGYEAAGWTRDIEAYPTIVDGGGTWDVSHLIHLEPGADLYFEGFTVQGAATPHSGGGFGIFEATAVISATVIQNNVLTNEEDGNGAGLHASGSNVTLINSIVQENEATQDGGGLWVCCGTILSLEDVVIKDNTGPLTSGGISSHDAQVDLKDSKIINNIGRSAAGLIGFSSKLVLENVQVQGNMRTGPDGVSGLGFLESEVTMTNVEVLDGNQTAVGLWSTSFNMTNILITGNAGAAITGDENAISGTIRHATISDNDGEGLLFTASDVSVSNSILWGNKGTDNLCNGCVITYSDIGTGDSSGMGNISADPKFRDPENGDYHLAVDSPAIDAGTPTGAPTTDIEGTPRDDAPDMGAFEWVGNKLYLPVILKG